MMAIQSELCLELLVNLAPDGWARWITGLDDAVVTDIMDLPRQWMKSDRYLLIQVKSYRRGEFFILNRWELDYDRDVPRQINAYAGMTEEQYRLPVYPVLVNILRPSRGTVISHCFHSNCLDLQVRQDFRVINLWDVSAEMAFSKSLAVLLPFVPIMRDGDNESTLKRAAILLEAENGFEELEELLAIFAARALGIDAVERTMKLQAEALRVSEAAGMLKREGQQEGTLQMLMALIQWRFGEVPLSVNAILPCLNLRQLRELGKRLLEVTTIDEFLACIFPIVDEGC